MKEVLNLIKIGELNSLQLEELEMLSRAVQQHCASPFPTDCRGQLRAALTSVKQLCWLNAERWERRAEVNMSTIPSPEEEAPAMNKSGNVSHPCTLVALGCQPQTGALAAVQLLCSLAMRVGQQLAPPSEISPVHQRQMSVLATSQEKHWATRMGAEAAGCVPQHQERTVPRAAVRQPGCAAVGRMRELPRETEPEWAEHKVKALRGGPCGWACEQQSCCHEKYIGYKS